MIFIFCASLKEKLELRYRKWGHFKICKFNLNRHCFASLYVRHTDAFNEKSPLLKDDKFSNHSRFIIHYNIFIEWVMDGYEKIFYGFQNYTNRKVFENIWIIYFYTSYATRLCIHAKYNLFQFIVYMHHMSHLFFDVNFFMSDLEYIIELR